MTGYKCYLLSKKHLTVYGVITENDKGMGIKMLHVNKKGRLVDSPYLPPSYLGKSSLESWQIEATLDEEEAIEFYKECQKLRSLK